jgi:multifunctional 2-oxoglutarate metabolism enzyme
VSSVKKDLGQETFGPNMWLVDEMYRRYQENPQAVGESWREFFDDYHPARPEADSRGRRGAGDGGPASSAPRRQEAPVQKETPAPEKESAPSRATSPAKTASSAKEASGEAKKGAPAAPESLENAAPLRGVAARIAENMNASLGLPTATSVRTIPAKLLEENRRLINRHLAAHRGGKVSFTHLIGWAILKALEAHPRMKSSYAEIEGQPHVVESKHVNFGLAVDVQRSAGARTLLVPNIKNADDLDFAGFFRAYEEIIRKVKKNELSLDDFAGTTMTLTNPGTVGTSLSVPRLMPGQGLIVGAGAIGWPPEYQGADPASLARVGIGKVITLTSTYDHRVIQGAESGEFLAHIHELLLGAHRFYDELFASLGIAHEPVRWSQDVTSIDDETARLEKQGRVSQLVNMYRVRGHLLAELNPIGWEVLSHPELDLSHYGLTVWDLERKFLTDGLPGPKEQPLRRIIDMLRDAYCHTVGFEYMHISDPEQKRWIQQRVEPGPEELDKEEKKHILDRLNAAEAFEKFLHSKYTGHRRYSIEGAESLVPMLDALFERAIDDGVVEAVMGTAHRGRLNILANIVGKPLTEIFDEFEGHIDPNTVQGSGDVKYHVGMTGSFEGRSGGRLGVVMASNPSHLESVNPVVEGMARGKQDVISEGADRILPVLVHGDAAFAGQGVVAETFNMSQLPGYKTGGTVHIVVNNQIGFTTAPGLGRSSTYSTDIAKMIQAPILHVNGDDPEACVRVVRLAYEFRKKFRKDVVIDLVCYRLHGHQEVDEPSFTQPLMYQHIEEHRSVRKLYTEALLNRGEFTVEEAEKSLDDFHERMQRAFKETHGSGPPAEAADILQPLQKSCRPWTPAWRRAVCATFTRC